MRLKLLDMLRDDAGNVMYQVSTDSGIQSLVSSDVFGILLREQFEQAHLSKLTPEVF